ncbi:MAG: phosphate transport system permease protein PstA [Planctomycetota bacterium]|nr:MAG: phosphate transport system permease protein PstA [Planctomycetota bacterium]
MSNALPPTGTKDPLIAAPSAPRARRSRRGTSLFAHGEPMIWFTGGSLVLALLMIIGLLGWVLAQGMGTFWPERVPQLELLGGERLMGELGDVERYTPEASMLDALSPELRARADLELAALDGQLERVLLRSGNFDISNTHYRWVDRYAIAHASRELDDSEAGRQWELDPARFRMEASASDTDWSLVVERLSWGRLYAKPVAFQVAGQALSDDPAEAWEQFEAHHSEARERWQQRRDLETHDIGDVNHALEEARLAARAAQMDLDAALAASAGAPRLTKLRAANEAAQASLLDTEELGEQRFAELQSQIRELDEQNARQTLLVQTADGTLVDLQLADVVRAYPANQLGLFGRLGVYASRWREFLFDDPREANSEGGVFPAIFGTVVMTLIMSLLVVPLGVLAALYLREYAKQGPIVSAVRIAVNNLAGVPSIVFGVFGLGFFCYIVGVSIDELFYSAKLPSPTFGTGGLLWASFTLALLTLPVVIVATEEALSAVPNSMREGSYACGATKWQTIQRIVLPRAAPGIMTGMVLAIARGAGEVAPLMLVGAVKLAPDLPIDVNNWSGSLGPIWTGAAHLERSFMHLGFHIYDLGFQSQNSEAAKPMVYTTTLLLIGIVVTLNLLAVGVRSRLRRRFAGTHV